MTFVDDYLNKELTIPILNVGSGDEVSIREVAQRICTIIGYDGELNFDPAKPDGTPRKRLDTKRMSDLGWSASSPLISGLERAYQDFCERHGSES